MSNYPVDVGFDYDMDDADWIGFNGLSIFKFLIFDSSRRAITSNDVGRNKTIQA